MTFTFLHAIGLMVLLLCLTLGYFSVVFVYSRAIRQSIESVRNGCRGSNSEEAWLNFDREFIPRAQRFSIGLAAFFVLVQILIDWPTVEQWGFSRPEYLLAPFLTHLGLVGAMLAVATWQAPKGTSALKLSLVAYLLTFVFISAVGLGISRIARLVLPEDPHILRSFLIFAIGVGSYIYVWYRTRRKLATKWFFAERDDPWGDLP